MFDRNFTMRLDKNTDALLKVLIKDLNFSKSQVIRRSLRLLKELYDIRNQSGEILVRTEEGEKILVLLS